MLGQAGAYLDNQNINRVCEKPRGQPQKIMVYQQFPY